MSNMFELCYNLTSIDLTSFDTSNVTEMYGMFKNCGSLENIYASANFTVESITVEDSTWMFKDCHSLRGGNGTVYNSSYIDKTYARIDTPSTPGYFTAK